MAHGALLAGLITNRIFYLAAALPDFKIEIAVLISLLLCAVLGPLLVFAPQLAQAKRTGTREDGTLAQRYVREFDAKWLRGGAPVEESLVGSADLQSLADLGNSFEVVRTMRLAPVTKEAILQLAAHHDAAGRTAETAARHLVLGNLPERMHPNLTLRLCSLIEFPCFFSLLARLSRDSNKLRTFVTDGEGMHDV